jgi:GNAT superfamily N-acetyltransferase
MMVRAASVADLPSIRLLVAGMPWADGDLLEKSIAAGHMMVAVVETAVRGFIVSNTRFFEKPFVWLVFVDAGYRRTGTATNLFAAVEYATIGELDLDPGDREVFYRSR